MKTMWIESKKYGKKKCTFDLDDYDKLSAFVWCIVPNRDTFYAMSRIKLVDKKYKTIRMHQLILPVKDGFVDHIDGNGLNNCKSNLRQATAQENNFNRGVTSRNKSGYKGVYKARKKYVACLRKSGKLIHGGVFNTAKEAAKRYNELALEYFGEFAWLNKI